jgi:glycerol-1-phosphate dehydrogenase [NAD(P)+]
VLQLPDSATPCACGMTHRVAIDEIAVESNAIERLAAYAESRRWRQALLVMDANTEDAVGWRVARELGGADVRVAALRFPNRSGLAADEDAVSAARARLRADDPDGVVAVGSGVLTDITRYATHVEDRSFVSVPTAASMDGYASSVAAMEFRGAKATFPASEPRGIFADPAVLAAAPAELTRSGLGDLLGKATARVDWMASHLLYGEAYCPAVDARVLEPLEFAANHAEAVLRHERAAVERLLQGLLQSGIAMAMMGSSRPASGCEHHASHLWDLLATRGMRHHAPHGLQVGYATQFAMRLQRFAFAGGVRVLRRPQIGDADEADPPAWFGESPAIREAMLGKDSFIAEHADKWPEGPEEWAAVRQRLAEALGRFPPVERALTTAGMPSEPDVLGIDAATLRATFRHASRLRARYTVIDFLKGQGVLSDALDAMLGARASDELVRHGAPE